MLTFYGAVTGYHVNMYLQCFLKYELLINRVACFFCVLFLPNFEGQKIASQLTHSMAMFISDLMCLRNKPLKTWVYNGNTNSTLTTAVPYKQNTTHINEVLNLIRRRNVL